MTRFSFGFTSLIAAWIASPVHADSFTPLGDLPDGADFGAAYAVSADGGVVAGESSGLSGTEAFIWTVGNGMTGLGDLADGNFLSFAQGVSSDGSVVVGLGSSASGLEAFRWTEDGGMVGLGDLTGGDFDSAAIRISADGNVVVGHSVGTAGREAFRWTTGDGMVGLGDLAGGLFFSRANGVSADGVVVVGSSTSASGTNEAFRWTEAGGMVGLGDLAGGSFASVAKDVSADGNVIVGYGTGTSGAEAIRWTAGGGMVGLGDLPGGNFQSFANGVSDDGNVVVGQGTSAAGPEAFRWTESGGIENLRDLLIANGVTGLEEWTLTTALDISADGQWIVGRGINPMGNTEPFLANVPLPKSLPEVLPDLETFGNFNGNNSTDLGVLRFDADAGRNKLYVMDGGSGNLITTVLFGTGAVRDSSAIADDTGDMIPEFGALVEGSLEARVKDAVNNTLLGKPGFNAGYDTVAFLSVGDVDGIGGADVAVVGRNPETGKVQVWVKEVASGSLVSRYSYPKSFVPFAAVVVDDVGGTPAMEIAVLGIDEAGNVQATVKDALSGELINKIRFDKRFTPLFFAAVPNSNGDLKRLAVLGRKASGVIQAQIKRVGNGTLVSKVRFSENYDPRAFISFADSNGSGGGEIALVGVNGSGAVRAQAKEIADGSLVNLISFSRKYPPLDAIATNGVAATGRNEIAVLGRNASGELRLQVKDLLTGDLVNIIPVP